MPQTLSKSSQEFVPIQEIRDGILILKNGAMRLILMVSSLNFALKSQEEQTAIIYQYQNFLNGLDFSIQIFVQSRPINIASYLNILRDREQQQTNELIRIQNREYIEFIKNLVETTNIVSKNFYIVVPFNPPVFEIGDQKGIVSKISGIFGKKEEVNSEQKEIKFEEYKEQLLQRGDVVISELARLGIRAAALGTEEAIELFYQLYNPGEREKGKMPLPAA